MATIGAKQPKNLTIVVLDNGHFGETGMQRSHTSLGTDLVSVAKGCSIAQAEHLHAIGDVEKVTKAVATKKGPALFQVKIKADDVPRALPSRDGVFVKNRFRAALGFEPF